MSIAPKHREPGTPADTVAALGAQWHLGITYPGLFPHHELSCPCPKAKCGLVIPDADIPCPEHHGQRPYRQWHLASTCTPRRRQTRRLLRRF